MKKVPKRMTAACKDLPVEFLPLEQAVNEVKSRASAKFDESINLDVCLAVDPKRSDQVIRGVVYPPSPIGKSVKVCVLAQGEAAKAAKDAGADFVGFEDIISKIEKEGAFFDCCISTTEGMKIVSKVARVLGPRGLMPNPKMGTVVSDSSTADLVEAVKRAKAGRIEYKSDSYGILHASVGKVSLSLKDLVDNATALIEDVIKARPTTLKGSRYLLRAFVSSTMGPSIKVDVAEFKR
jgi:large subunit ribosomal protein L1